MSNARDELPVPPHFDPALVGSVWRVDYEQRARDAIAWRSEHAIAPAAQDSFRLGLVLIDVQNTFCIPGFELFVAGRDGHAAVDDNARLCAFIYRNLHRITAIVATLDTHSSAQLFHAAFFEDTSGNPPAPFTSIALEQIVERKWRPSAAARAATGLDDDALTQHLVHYCRTLASRGRDSLIVWPYHAMAGGIGHALVGAVEEACFFHAIARSAPTELIQKGRFPLTESYSALGPEVDTCGSGASFPAENPALLDRLLAFDALVIAGQAKSHCVAWTVQDLLNEIKRRDPNRAGRVYLLEDCTSPVVVPGGPDFSAAAEEAFERFAEAGMHRVRSTEPNVARRSAS